MREHIQAEINLALNQKLNEQFEGLEGGTGADDQSAEDASENAEDDQAADHRERGQVADEGGGATVGQVEEPVHRAGPRDENLRRLRR